MDVLDKLMTMVLEKKVSDAEFDGVLDTVDAFAKEHLENTDALAKAAMVRRVILDKMNNKGAASFELPKEAKEKDMEPMSHAEVMNELENLRKLENNPMAYMDKCEEILKNPRDVVLVGQVIHGMGNVVEKNPDTIVANEAIRVLKHCTDNEELLKLDTEYSHIHLVEVSMEETIKKIRGTHEMSSVWKADDYLTKYSKDRLHMVMNNALEEVGDNRVMEVLNRVEQSTPDNNAKQEFLEKRKSTLAERLSTLRGVEKTAPGKTGEMSQAVTFNEDRSSTRVAQSFLDNNAKSQSLEERKPTLAVQLSALRGVEKPALGKTGEISQAVMLNEDKLPKIKLAGNAGKEGVEFDLNSIAEELKSLQPGQSLALGRNPEAKLGQGCKAVKVGEDNLFVSRHHCDIRRNEQGKLELVDRSMNGTEVLPDKSAGKEQNKALQMAVLRFNEDKKHK